MDIGGRGKRCGAKSPGEKYPQKERSLSSIIDTDGHTRAVA